MGNQLAGIAPSEIYPVEHYFPGNFGNELVYDSSMGSTRFFKVARAKCVEGLVIVKVFVIHDPSLPIEEHKKQIEFIRKMLSNAVNCLPFRKVELTDKAGYIIREYVRHSLYDRVSTRPFLSILEKKWITFQLLCALNQCHKQKVCHGDIKLENILITSWNWVLLSDFASFKPTYLPEDNPADYTYFFDTSRRRTCYIAPERFAKSMEVIQDKNIPLVVDSIVFPTRSKVNSVHCNNLLPEMDIFSAGCALLELWSEGTAPFEFSQLLAYSKGEKNLVNKHLQRIENENLRNLLQSMLKLNPKKRMSAEVYLDQERGKLFPDYFYSFLQSYLQMFSCSPISPDDKILRLHSDIDHCIKVLTNERHKKEIKERSFSIKANNRVKESDGLTLIITLVTSCIRGLNHCCTKIHCLEILQELSLYTNSEIILDRILPYIIYLAKDSSSLVRAQAIDTLSSCLMMVKDVPRSDANVFPEYILPSIASLSTDSACIVRISFARNIAMLSTTAVYFLEETQRNSSNDLSAQRYEAELNALHEIIQKIVLSLLTDHNSVVKHTLIESEISKLCSFFGKKKSNDVILSHVITFLNEREDKHLRDSFFQSVMNVVGYVGWQSSDIVIPLFQQGLTDSEELVIAKSIYTMAILIDMGHIQKHSIIEFVLESSCYLNHPNLWIRHEMCGLISTIARKLSSIDLECRIMPLLLKYIKTPLIQIHKPDIIWDCLNRPIPRKIFDDVIKFQEFKLFYQALEKRQKKRNRSDFCSSSEYNEFPTSIKNLFQRLSSEGLTDFVENQLLTMKTFITKLNKYKSLEPKIPKNGNIFLYSRPDIGHIFFIRNDQEILNNLDLQKIKVIQSSGEQTQTNLNWQNLIEGIDDYQSNTKCSIFPESIYADKKRYANTYITKQNCELYDFSVTEKKNWHEYSSKCREDLETVKKKLTLRCSSLRSFQYSGLNKDGIVLPSSWRIQGNLVANVHEHNGLITKLTSLKSCALFASGSIDGTVRLWDCNKLNGNQQINKSRQIYFAKTPINSIASCDGGQSIAVGSKDCSLILLRIDRNSTKMTLQTAIYLDESKDGLKRGPITDMVSFEQNFSGLILYSTLYGNIIAWDMRMQDIAWNLQNDLKHGVITTICANPNGFWLAAGTSGGKHICWDLRFCLPIAEIRHPSDSWIRKIICHPTEPSSLISASQSNNEVSIWNIETGYRQTVLWASSAPVFSNTCANSPSTSCAMLSGVHGSCPFILTGSSDQRIRYWDLFSPENSTIVVRSPKDSSDTSFKYECDLIDGSRVIKEKAVPVSCLETMRNNEELPRCGPDMPNFCHNDGITDLIMCTTENNSVLTISSSREGVINIWK